MFRKQGVQSSGFRVWGSGSRVRVQGSGQRVFIEAGEVSWRRAKGLGGQRVATVNRVMRVLGASFCILLNALVKVIVKGYLALPKT